MNIIYKRIGELLGRDKIESEPSIAELEAAAATVTASRS